MTIRLSFAPLALAALLLAAGCSDDEAGTPTGPTPAASEQMEPTADVPGMPSEMPDDAPKVEQPIENLDRFMSAPCDALTRSQAAEIGLDDDIQTNLDNAQGPQCALSNEKRDRLTIVFSKNQPLGIAGLYLNKQQSPDFYAYFEPVDIAGHPGVFADVADDRNDGLCAMSVGLTDKQIAAMVIDIKGETDPCSTLKKAAKAAIQTMKKG